MLKCRRFILPRRTKTVPRLGARHGRSLRPCRRAAVGGEVVPASKNATTARQLPDQNRTDPPFLGNLDCDERHTGRWQWPLPESEPVSASRLISKFPSTSAPGQRSNHQTTAAKQRLLRLWPGHFGPADGTVVTVVDGVPENPPGVTDIYYRFGNAITPPSATGNMQCWVTVPGGKRQSPRRRSRITRTSIARCGNSGNSTAPHLHFQLSDSPDAEPGRQLAGAVCPRRSPRRSPKRASSH